MNSQQKSNRRRFFRSLHLERLDLRLPLDANDVLSGATSLGTASTTSPDVVNAGISPSDDVDLYRVTVTAGQMIDFDIDTSLNGPGGLGSYIRLFNAGGDEIFDNNNALAPGENTVGFDAYLRFVFPTTDFYYLGVSNANNSNYDPETLVGRVTSGTNATGNYTLTVTLIPLDDDDTIAESTSFGSVTPTPDTIADEIFTDIDVDMYRFTVTTGETVDFDIDTSTNGTGGLGSFIRIFNGTGQELAFNDNGVAPGETVLGFDAYLRHTFSTAGTYYIGVSGPNNTLYDPLDGEPDQAGGPNSIGAYSLTLNTAPAIPPDPDDTLTDAVSLGAITTTVATRAAEINPDSDVDLYRFTVTANQVVDFDIDTTTNGAPGLGSFIRLFDSAGVEIAFNNNGNAPGENVVGFDAYLRRTFTSAGTFYLGVSNAVNTLYNPVTGDGDTTGGTNTIGAYTLNVRALPVDNNDSIPEATSLGTIVTTPDVVNDQIDPDIDVDIFSFDVTAGQIIDFDIDTTANGPGGLGSFLRLFDSTGARIASNDNGVAPGESVVGFDAYLRFTFATAGTYYVGVSNATNASYGANTGTGDTAGGFNSIGAYTLTVNTAPTPPVDPDDTITDANSLGSISTTPVSRNASITPDVDVDLYRFTVTAGQVVDFDIDTTINGAGGLGSFIRLFDSAGTEIAFNNNGNAPGEDTVGFDAYLRRTFTAAGTFYLGVSNANNTLYNVNTGDGDVSGGANATGDYTLIVQALPVDDDDELSEAPFLGAVNTTAALRSATITPDIDVDLYRFTANANQIVDFDIDTTLNGPGGLGSFLRLFNSAGTEIAFNNNAAAPGEGTVGFDAFIRHTFTASGTYYVGVSNATNTLYNTTNGLNDTSGGFNSIGSYDLRVQEVGSSGNDTDDALSEAIGLGTPTTSPNTISANISPDTDVNLYSFTATAGQVIDFDIDTPLNGPGGLGSFIRLFDSTGAQLSSNDNAAAPGEGTLGFDSYLRFTAPSAGTYYLGVSNATNVNYNPVNGSGDVAGGANATGSYQLIVTSISATTTLALSSVASTISEAGGTTTGTVTRTSPNISAPLVVNLSSNDTSEATVPSTVTIPANLTSVTFTITGVDDTVIDGTQNVTITATATGFTGATLGVLVTDNDGTSALALSSVASTISEAGGTTTGTVTRTSPNITSPLVVNLSSNDTGEATVPTSVTIPANQTSITFTITGIDDTAIDGTQNVTITATASGFTSATLGILVTDNDSATSTLGLSSVVSSITEAGGTTTGTVTRTSANISSPLVVNLSSNDTGEATVPTSVTIPANQTSITFTITGVDDTVIDGTQSVTITATASGFTSATLGIQVIDNESATLGLSSVASSISEGGGTTTGTVTRTSPNISSPLVVNLSSNDTGEATVPASVTIPAGQTSTTFTITGIDDALVDGTQSVTITATASGFTSATLGVQVTDNEAATLGLSSVASSISEAGGTTTGTVTRTSANISSPLVVNLSSNDTGEATVPTSVTIPAGQTSATFTITGIDDAVVDGTQSVTITATASGFTSATLGVQVTDNDSGPTLGLSSVASSISEGGGTTTGTVTRTSPNISAPLVVNLSSNDTGEATVPTSVTIPANQTSATFTITGINDAIIDGNQFVTITATASGFTTATLGIQVRDNDSPWQNPNNPLDVNNDGQITAFDALPIISHLNLFPAGTLPSGSPPPYLDVNSDNQVTAFDALEIITYLNLNPIGAPEATSAPEGQAASKARAAQTSQEAALIDAYFSDLGRRDRRNQPEELAH